ncbi:hypothetical protein [Actinoplanes aureus]|uniref:Lipoprotein n=1 Tax=Actinoplanes aureus TaxID=2792083 RepID=A0A931CLC5_9ACTN|nr:hypothetical protein [Actinoplanes aureus]MBG0569136.1 hypothetical protein [Actinoplanes aureus]
MRRVRVVKLLAAGILAMHGTGCAEFSGATLRDRAGLTGTWRTAGCEFSRSPQHAVVGGVRTPVTPARLAAAMERIEQGGRERFAASYAGIEVDQIRVRAHVYRVPSAAFDDYLRHSAEDSCIVVRDAAHAVAELGAWHDRVIADLPFWTARGVRIVAVGSRHDGVGVEVGTRDFDRARRILPARYGSRAPLVFVEEGPVMSRAEGRPVAPGAGG